MSKRITTAVLFYAPTESPNRLKFYPRIKRVFSMAQTRWASSMSSLNSIEIGAGASFFAHELFRIPGLHQIRFTRTDLEVEISPVYTWEEILPQIHAPDFDGYEAVNFIIEQAKKKSDRKLVLLAIGKLTNIALALENSTINAEQINTLLKWRESPSTWTVI